MIAPAYSLFDGKVLLTRDELQCLLAELRADMDKTTKLAERKKLWTATRQVVAMLKGLEPAYRRNAS